MLTQVAVTFALVWCCGWFTVTLPSVKVTLFGNWSKLVVENIELTAVMGSFLSVHPRCAPVIVQPVITVG